jgi:DNA-binding beta-propeller fold protein YncE
MTGGGTVTRSRNLIIGLGFITTFVVLGVVERGLARRAEEQTAQMVEAPRFEVDPTFPKPLPNGWLIGMTIGIGIDAQDRVWIIHRPDTLSAEETAASQTPPTAACCKAAPPVLAFDQQGNLVASWGGPGEGFEWPESNHGIFIDHKGIVWIGGNGTKDSHILKFTQQGKFIAQYGKMGQNKGSNDTANFGRVAKIIVDPRANEAYLADGYLNKRVAVIDADTGAFKRYWGAYGNKPDDTSLGTYDPSAPPAQQFRNPVHCSDLSVDDLVYVCDRPNDRIQVFTKEGKFVKEKFIATKTLGDGSTWDVAFSKDPQQKYMYVADGKNERIYVLDRQSLEILTEFGDGGRQPGQFFAVHSIATDSRGNLFTTETYEGRRLQKFTYKGIAKVPRVQGVVWPTGR